jgi:hypothetical protein
MARIGKIARLPKAIRDRLNQQIRDGVPGTDLIVWLNDLKPVQEVLCRHFNGREINENNLTEWRQGGYKDWLAHQDRLDWTRCLSDEAEDIAADSGDLPFIERVGALFEVVLGKFVEQLLATPEAQKTTAGDFQNLIQFSQELARHRSLSQSAVALRLKAEQHRKAREKSMDEQVVEARQVGLSHVVNLTSQNSVIQTITSKMSPEQRADVEQLIDRITREKLEIDQYPSFADTDESRLFKGPDPGESD